MRQFFGFFLLLTCLVVNAEDIDLFVNKTENIPPNVTFLMDNSPDLAVWETLTTRMGFMTAAASRVLDLADNINVSIAVLSDEGGAIYVPSMNLKKYKNTIQSRLEFIEPVSSFKSIDSALYEVFNYYAGESPFTSTLYSGTTNGSVYQTPIQQSCQRNIILVFTWRDLGVRNSDAISRIRSLISGVSDRPSFLNTACGTSSSDDCFGELAWYMNNVDINTSMPSKQTATIYAVSGFGSGQTFEVINGAKLGGGEAFYFTNDIEEQDRAIYSILSSIYRKSSSFSAPAVSTSAFNSLETSEDVYYAVFKPGEGANWKGNLKRYRLGDDNQIYDADGKLAIDQDTGFFRDDARSFWSSSSDGKDVEAGGITEHISQNRPVYTNLDGDRAVSLSESGNRFHESNSGLTASRLGLTSTQEQSKLIQWARNVDVFDEDKDGSRSDNRPSIGDPLHTSPQVVTYFSNPGSGGVDRTVYFGTNDGFLHGVDSDNGNIEFSFIPRDLLPVLQSYYSDASNSGDFVNRVYAPNYDTSKRRIKDYFSTTESSGIKHSITIAHTGTIEETDRKTFDFYEDTYYEVTTANDGLAVQSNLRIAKGGRELHLSDSGAGGARGRIYCPGCYDDMRLKATHGRFLINNEKIYYVIPSSKSINSHYFGIDSKQSWQNSRVWINAPARLRISSGGWVDWGPGFSSPDGVYHPYNLVYERFPHEALLGRIGGGSPFFVGTAYDVNVTTSGWLEFLTNDSERSDNVGFYTAKIVVEPTTTGDDGYNKPYGLDGSLTVWVNDANGDGNVLNSSNGSPQAGEHVYLYLTLRRGGNNIYALDVTDRSNPTLKWVIRGDTDNNHSADLSGDFARLGQTWSAAQLAKVNWNGNERQVLFFGGGYDVEVDGQATIQANDIGHAVYMVDAETGELLWEASQSGADLNISGMRYSIPADLSLVDINQDGLTDFFYAVDMGGQVIRFDINEGNTGAGSFAQGGVIARLAGTAAADARRFFEPVDVSVSSSSGYLNLAVGSGLRHSPMNTVVRDRMYVIRDPNIYQPPLSYGYQGGSVITESSLYNVTDNVIQQGSDSQRAGAIERLNASQGWYLDLEESGEKVLSKASVFSRLLLFNTFSPILNDEEICSPTPGVNYSYVIDIETGGAVFNFGDLGNNGSLNKSNRKKTLKHSTIAPKPTILFQGNKADVCVGTECFKDILENINAVPVKRSFWRENR